MPKTDGRVVCVNHPSEEMTKPTGFHTVANTKKQGAEVEVGFDGPPLMMYLCKKCGYVEFYSPSPAQWERGKP
jgi:hypothetical protein